MRQILLLFLLFFTAPNMAAVPDSMPRMSVEMYYYSGAIIKHTDKILADTKGYGQGWEASVSFQTHGKQSWNKGLGYPAGGISLVQLFYPNRDTIGMCTGILPHISFFLLRKEKANLYLRAGIGLALASKQYDAIENPQNTIIGTKLNTLVQFKIGSEIKVSTDWGISLSGGLTHISNAGTKLPNLGINFAGGDVGVVYHFTEVSKKEADVPAYNKNVYWIRGGIGWRQRAFDDGPKYYPIYNTYIGYSRHTGYNNRLSGALNITYDNGNYHKILDYNPEIKEKQKADATSVSVMVGDELLIGQLGLVGMVGFYLYYPIYKPLFMYFRVGVNVYTKPLVKNTNIRSFFGIHMKTHGSTAEHFEVASGFTF